MSESYEQLGQILFEEFEKTEAAIKQAEHNGEALPIPSVNELRYAGFHHIAATRMKNSGNEEAALEEMRKAVRHVRRAKFDITEFYLTLCAEEIAAYRKSYSGYEFLAAQLIPNYYEHEKNMHDAGILIKMATSWDKESEEYIRHSNEVLQKIRAFAKDFQTAKPALFAAIADKESGKKISWMQCVVGMIGSAIIGTGFGFLLSALLQ